MIGTLAVDVWVVTFGKARSGSGQAAAPAQSPHRCTKCRVSRSTAIADLIVTLAISRYNSATAELLAGNSK